MPIFNNLFQLFYERTFFVVIKYAHSQMDSFFLNIHITICKLFDKILGSVEFRGPGQ